MQNTVRGMVSLYTVLWYTNGQAITPASCKGDNYLLRDKRGISPFDHLQRLTNSLPKLSLTTLPPPETAG